MALEGGSVGLQLGGEATDFVLLLMTPNSASSILTSKVKLGGDASAAAGPVGRNASAETDAAMKAEILSYSRAKGAFAGVSLEGSTLRPDNYANKDLHGKKMEAKEIVLDGTVQAPPSASILISTLDKGVPGQQIKVLVQTGTNDHNSRLTDAQSFRPGARAKRLKKMLDSFSTRLWPWRPTTMK
jgi:lipid-binding SYLF domain-containing protein